MLQTPISHIPVKMQTAALSLAPSPPLPLLKPTKTSALPWKSSLKLQALRFPHIKATAAQPDDISTVDYSSSATSVFPAEACETIGGEACDAEIYPEVKLKPETKTITPKSASNPVDREYIEYNNPKTVFPGEACDDLGGEFCEPEYQSGVYK